MHAEFEIGPKLSELVERMVGSYKSDPRTHRIDKPLLPSRQEIEEIVQLLLELVYPGYHGRQDLNSHNVAYHVGELLPRVGRKLFRQIYQCLCYQHEMEPDKLHDRQACRDKSRQMTIEFLDRLPRIRQQLAGDVQAAYDGDPAAVNTDEVILAYPGVLAVTVYRLAHELHEMAVPLMPRIMTEWAHSMTGVDIHPGASIGRSFFIDHATGVVIGETTEIGDNVKLYQGVTLGALSFPKDERGRLIRGYKRHPTVKDKVAIYANATVLGGETVIGQGCTVNGSVFLTQSAPDGCTVAMKPPELRYHNQRPRAGGTADAETDQGDAE
jgi:serine O-acetyltransferase